MENGAHSGKKDSGSPSELNLSSELSNDTHFLVTHWLANYGANKDESKSKSSNGEDSNDSEKTKVVKRIQGLAGELATAFEQLGAYGQALQVSEY